MDSLKEPSCPMASLYVGDLQADVNEAMLLEKFSVAGPVLSIRLCRDNVTKRSLCYAYINFQKPQDAERALDTMNFDPMNGRPIRIMWTRRDPSLRDSGVGNVFIKNLDKSINNKDLHDTFAAFGNILSCKIATDGDGSRGYGFVHFQTEEAARNAICNVNGTLLNGKEVLVENFKTRRDRLEQLGFNNVYVKNFGVEMDDDKLRDMFEPYGNIISAKVMTDNGPHQKSKGFGFVSFEDPESAEKAVEELNGMIINGKPLYAGRSQKKAERHADLKKTFRNLRMELRNHHKDVKSLDDNTDDERLRKEFSRLGTTSDRIATDGDFQTEEAARNAICNVNGTLLNGKEVLVENVKTRRDQQAFNNVYVKNFGDEMDDDKLRDMFEPYGKIISAKVMTDDGPHQKSKGFGFVSFEDPQSAEKAVEELNGMDINGKTLYAGRSQKKAERHADLKKTFRDLRMEISNHHKDVKSLDDNTEDERLRKEFSQSGTTSDRGQQTGQMTQIGQPGGGAEYFVPQMPQTQRSLFAPKQISQLQAGPILKTMRQPIPAEGCQTLPAEAQIRHTRPTAVRNRMDAASITGQTGAPQPRMAMNQQPIRDPPNVQAQPNRGAFTTQMCNPPQPVQPNQPMQQSQQDLADHGQDPLTTSMLAAAPSQDQNQLLGECLFPRLQKKHPKFAAKITGMSPNHPMEDVKPQKALTVHVQEPLTASMLAAARPKKQKKMLGERLFPLIQRMYPDLAGKITGMLLDIDNSEILHMLESNEYLEAKVKEAVAELQDFSASR